MEEKELKEKPVEEVKKEAAAQEAQEPIVIDEEAPKDEAPAAPEKSPKEIVFERVRASRPEGKYDEDEEEYYRNVTSMLDDLEKKGSEFDKMTEKILARFKSNPAQAAVWLDYLDGMPLTAAIVKNLGKEALEQVPEEGDEDYEAWKKADEEYAKRVADEGAMLEELIANGKASDEAIAEYAKENGLSEEEAKEFKDFVLGDYQKFQKNIIDKDMLHRYGRMRSYDKDIEGAREQGRIDARNEKIEAEKKRMEGSGLPNANAGGEANTEVEPEKPKNATAAWLGRMNHK